jgi:D-glycero-D-manno-heptose 1,7-bisphosphate phosphatase
MGISKIVKKAVFLDRDGVINPNVLNKATGEWESPHHPDDFYLFPWALDALKKLGDNGYCLFLVSNQPSYAKGKTSLENIKAIQDKFQAILKSSNICFTEHYYCYHHPNGIVPELSIKCECRKPGILFLKEAESKYSIAMEASWFIGDRESDIICGRSAGTRTIMVTDVDKPRSKKTIECNPDYKAGTLIEAVDIILAAGDHGSGKQIS